MTDHLAVLREQLERELPAAIELRHQVHRQPQLSGSEGPTRDLVLAALPKSSTAQRVARTGAVVRIGGAGPAVAVRAELDALPVLEATGLDWASERDGVMHSCGHDVHLAALVALARAVHEVGGPAPLLAVLQPREETYPSGAQDITDDGILERENAGAVIGAHVQPMLRTGTVACVPGAVNASSDEFTITVTGRGGHAAYPHQTLDPVVALSHVVVALQTLVSRRSDPTTPVVLSITTLAAGNAANVIPDSATARGTVRTMDPLVRVEILDRLREVVDLVSRANGCFGRTEITVGEPVLQNDVTIALATDPLLRSLGLTVDVTLRSAGSDDFSYFAERVPGLMMFVGTENPGDRLHSATFAPDDGHVRLVAHAMLAGYLAAAAQLVPGILQTAVEGAVL